MLPGPDSRLIPRIIGIQFQRPLARFAPVVPAQRHNACTPLLFEAVGSRIDRRAAKIECAIALPPRKTQQFPKQKHIWPKRHCICCTGAPVCFNGVAIAREKSSANRLAGVPYTANKSFLRKCTQNKLKKSLA